MLNMHSLVTRIHVIQRQKGPLVLSIASHNQSHPSERLWPTLASSLKLAVTYVRSESDVVFVD